MNADTPTLEGDPPQFDARMKNDIAEMSRWLTPALERIGSFVQLGRSGVKLGPVLCRIDDIACVEVPKPTIARVTLKNGHQFDADLMGVLYAMETGESLLQFKSRKSPE